MSKYRKKGPDNMITIFDHPESLHNSGYDHKKMISFREFCEREMERIKKLGVKCEIIQQRNSENIGLCRTVEIYGQEA